MKTCPTCQAEVIGRIASAVFCSDYCRRRSPEAVARDRAYKAGRPHLCSVQNCQSRRHAYGFCGRHGHRHVRYGLTAEEMAALDAGVPCEICDRPASEVDHDHQTEARRGYLCRACNVSLGMMEDSPDRLRRAADYLEHHGLAG